MGRRMVAGPPFFRGIGRPSAMAVGTPRDPLNASSSNPKRSLIDPRRCARWRPGRAVSRHCRPPFRTARPAVFVAAVELIRAASGRGLGHAAMGSPAASGHIGTRSRRRWRRLCNAAPSSSTRPRSIHVDPGIITADDVIMGAVVVGRNRGLTNLIAIRAFPHRADRGRRPIRTARLCQAGRRGGSHCRRREAWPILAPTTSS